jgi:hypothetical protein
MIAGHGPDAYLEGMDPGLWVIVAATAPVLCASIANAVYLGVLKRRRKRAIVAFADARDLDFDGACIYGDLEGVDVRIDFLGVGQLTRVRARVEAPLELRAWVFRDRKVFKGVAPDARGQRLDVEPFTVVISDAALAPELLTSKLRHALAETTLDTVLHYDHGDVTLLWPGWEDDHGVLDRGLAVVRAFRGATSAYRS